ncbi:hypothetical protein RND81_14G016700 [Saponaria officinalis]|uniref:Uncharacterized protein n=1 Tax=Saponaria officinalis TaxID=3572 RepID=A0AAW1GI15_SAPOF
MAGNKPWQKAKQALGCLQLQTLDGDNETVVSYDDNPQIGGSTRVLDEGEAPVVPRSPSQVLDEGASSSSSKAPVPVPRSPSRPKICEICSSAMIPGQGATFNAECSHTFHFSCITSNLKYGNRICPVCRATWKEIPFQIRNPGPRENRRENWVPWNRNEPWEASLQQQPTPQPTRFIEPEIYDDDEAIQQQIMGAEQAADSTLNITTYTEVSATTRFIEPDIYDDDEAIEQQITGAEQAAGSTLEITTCPDVSAISKSSTFDGFTIHVHLKAPTPNPRVPVDVVVVVDVSGSMTGAKLSVLKRDVGFLIRHLTPRDRLSIIACSSTALRLFPLRLMNDASKTEAVKAVDSVSTNGGTNIGEGLRKAVKVLTDCKFKNPVGLIFVFTDGKETYTESGTEGYELLIPSSIPVHTFFIGEIPEDSPLYLISMNSGGKITYRRVDGVNQDALALYIGGLLSVFAQQLTVYVESSLQLRYAEGWRHHIRMRGDVKEVLINAGVLYAEDHRDFLITVNIPVTSDDDTLVLKINCTYQDPVTQNRVTSDEVKVKIDRPETVGSAERGKLARAVEIVKSCHETISASTSGVLSRVRSFWSESIYLAWATTRCEASANTDVSQADQTAVVLGNVLPR